MRLLQTKIRNDQRVDRDQLFGHFSCKIFSILSVVAIRSKHYSGYFCVRAT
jgi:hypothetical protein